MRVSRTHHLAREWVLPSIVPDFELLDVWALPARGGPHDFPAFLEVVADLDPAASGSRLSRALFAVRFLLGRVLGWDAPRRRPVPGCTEATLADRLPELLRGTAGTPVLSPAARQAAGGFVPLFRTEDEWAAELSNGTVHGVLQLTWAPDPDGAFRAFLAVWVKPRGPGGRAYLLAIEPFRLAVVYPALLRQVGRAWRARQDVAGR